MVSQNSVNETPNFNPSYAVALYSLCWLQIKTNQLEGNSTKYAEVYFNGSWEPLLQLVIHLLLSFGGDFLFSFGI